MTMLQAPDGTRYETDSDAEVRELTLGHGYRLIAADTPPPEPTQPFGPELASTASEPSAPHPDTPKN